MESSRVTSTFRSLIATGLIISVAIAAVVVLNAPIYVGLFGAALVFVIVDAVIPGGIISGRRRRLRVSALGARDTAQD